MQREIGNSGIKASVVGFGACPIGGEFWGGTDVKEAVRTLRTAIDSGINLIDTAPIYGYGLSEQIIGEVIATNKREDIVICDKVGLVWDSKAGQMLVELNGKPIYKELSANSIRRQVEQSLQDLQTDYIDILLSHWQTHTTPLSETIEIFERLKQEGKIRAYGFSNIESMEQLDIYLAQGNVACAEEHYNMLHRYIESEVLPACVDNNISVFAYSPLAQGLLTGNIKAGVTFPEGDFRQHMDESYSAENIIEVEKLLASIAPIADKHQSTIAQIVIAWTFNRPGISHVLCGARKAQHAKLNAQAMSIELSAEDISTITQAVFACHASYEF